MFCQLCGHELPNPVPRFCTYCGAPTSPTSGIIMPAGEGPAQPPPRYYCPWEDRAKLGFWKAFWDTLKSILTQPTEFYQKLEPEGNLGSAIGFAVLTGSIGAIVGILWQIPFQLFQSAIISTHNPSMAVGQTAFQMVLMIVVAITAPLWVLIGLFIISAITHFVLWLLGGANKSFTATIRVVSYAMSAAILNIIPFCGGFIGTIWEMVIEIIGLKEVHETTYGKSIAAKLIPIFICCCCMLVMFAFIFSMIGISLRDPEQIRQFFERLANR